MILDEIMASKKAELEGVKERLSLKTLQEKLTGLPPVRDFVSALKADGPSVIAEVKKASPSKGVIREDFDPVEIALAYEANGAAVISVLTEEKYFMGSLDFLSAIRERVSLPLLRKDFIFDYYQLVEARVHGADAVLLIAAVLDEDTLKSLLQGVKELGLFTLVEVHDEAELNRAVKSGAEVIGINNRNLKTFLTDIETTKRLVPLVPDGRIVVSESGINTRADIDSLMEVGVDAFLIGEALMREPNPGLKLKDLLSAG
jgi:indole-3-glycerol phosphate synthase